jgi:pyruvate dehydrogenase E2 component (dihydrolipoamide acetyltransferase)
MVKRRERFTNVVTTATGLSIEMDEPADFGGTGQRPDPAEYLLGAVGSSLSVTLTAHAALRSLAIHSVEIALAADLDGRSFFAPRTWPRAGLLNMQIDITLTSNLNEARARALMAEVLRASPVFRSLKRRPKVTLALRDIP